MGEYEHRGLAAANADAFLEYDLADAIYAACLVDSLRGDSPFYFMDEEDGGTSFRAYDVPRKRAA